MGKGLLRNRVVLTLSDSNEASTVFTLTKLFIRYFIFVQKYLYRTNNRKFHTTNCLGTIAFYITSILIDAFNTMFVDRTVKVRNHRTHSLV